MQLKKLTKAGCFALLNFSDLEIALHADVLIASLQMIILRNGRIEFTLQLSRNVNVFERL